MQSKLPVLATINTGNDLADLIQAERVGRACTDDSIDTLQRLAEELARVLRWRYDDVGPLPGAVDKVVFARCRPEVMFQGKNARILLDQLRCVDKARLGKTMGKIDEKVWHGALLEMLA